jgi:hypothetical protein
MARGTHGAGEDHDCAPHGTHKHDLAALEMTKWFDNNYHYMVPEFSRGNLYGMIHPDSDPSVTARAVYVVDPQKKIRLILTYPPGAGRNFQEILRSIDSLQLTDREKVSTPVNWQPGQPVIISPSVSNEQAKTRFPQGWKELKPYLRIVQLHD